jgi:hypothetical protein
MKNIYLGGLIKCFLSEKINNKSKKYQLKKEYYQKLIILYT